MLAIPKSTSSVVTLSVEAGVTSTISLLELSLKVISLFATSAERLASVISSSSSVKASLKLFLISFDVDNTSFQVVFSRLDTKSEEALSFVFSLMYLPVFGLTNLTEEAKSYVTSLPSFVIIVT